MDKSKFVAVFVVIAAALSVYFFVGTTTTFNKRVEYLSEKYPIYECIIDWKDYPSYANNHALINGFDYECNKAKSWTAFKSIIHTSIQQGTFLDSIFYEPDTRTIWFNTLEWVTWNQYKYTTWYIN